VRAAGVGRLVTEKGSGDFGGLARRLRMTERQRRFAEALAADATWNQTRAALVAGVAPERAAIQGSRWVRLSKVQECIAALSWEAIMAAERRTGKAVASLTQILELLSAQMRCQKAWTEHGQAGTSVEKG
jgi:phage terminase small subunit